MIVFLPSRRSSALSLLFIAKQICSNASGARGTAASLPKRCVTALGGGLVNWKLLSYPEKLQLLQSIQGGGCRGRQCGDQTNWAGGGNRGKKGSRMNNSQPGFNDLSGGAVVLMSEVKEGDPGGKRVQVCVVQLTVSVFYFFFPPVE